MATKPKKAAESGTNPQIQRTQANRKRRLQKLLKAQPNNTQLQNALLEVGTPRKKPANPQWSHTMIREAKLFKLFTGSVPKDIFSSNDKVREQARLHAHREHFEGMLPQGKVDFSLGARVGVQVRSHATWN